MRLALNIRIDRRWKRSLTGIALLLGIAAPVHVSADAQAARQLLGRPVADVLRQLQAEGARLIFTNVLVPPDLRVTVEPRAAEPLDIAREILAPHGLTLRASRGNTWLVVRGKGAAPPAPGQRERDDAAPPPERPAAEKPAGQAAVIRIEEHVDVSDRLGDLATQPSVYRVDPAAVLTTAGGLENLFQVLPTLPGVAATNDEEGKLAVRGGGPEHNVVVFDGVQIHSPQRAGDFGASLVNPAVTADVAFDASGLDARHGGRLSSVTVLETRNGVRDRRLALSGSMGLTSGDVLVEGRLPGTESGSWWAAARGTYYKFVAERFGDAGIPGFVDVQFKIHVRPTPRTELSLVGLMGEESMVQRWSGPNPGIGSDDIRRELDGDNRLAAMNLRWTPGPRMTTVTTVTAYASAFRYQDHLIVPLHGPFDRDVRVADLAARHRASVAWWRGHLLDAGVEARRLKSSWAMTGSTPAPLVRPVGPDTWGGSIEYDGPIHSRLSKTLLGAWVQDRIPLGAGLVIEPGARVDWNSLTGESALQPRVRLTKRSGGTVLWAGLAWQAQTPGHETMQQGYSFFDLTGPEASGLRNERSRQLVVGVERELTRGMTVRLEAYRRAFERLLVQRQETDAERDNRLSRYVIPPDMAPDSAILEYRPTVHPESTGTGRATGLELLLQRSSGRVTGWVSYTLSKAERELYGRTVSFDFDRRHAVAIALNLQLSSRIRLSATSQYATGFALTPLHPEPAFPEEQLLWPPPTPPFTPVRNANGELVLRTAPQNPLRLSLLNSARMPPYARTDARVSFALTNWLEVYGEVINLFGRDNFHPQADFRSDFVAQYEVAPSLPRLPTYGVRLKF